ncbi:sigma-70 family RNA polymerase sigma factor [Streptomyces sp. NBC_01373]|uniref:sigma-70 family RNA polymerase sigma factor n=1 Tax=Streptomyces sp. NBC_01373 TaxID=2903843 RepID=UPI002251C812|nr:sigma-70 family RNA polymerase sigma factor [Streptomyces sp. NBC_01373]MCX4702718.1 sigma-70 family RNA polymerase sigma factor [Streptomyces sp. NBC_01373]
MDTHLAEAGEGREMTGTTAGPTTEPTIDGLDYATSVFIHARPGLLKIAGGIVGNANDAEDVVQETWLRWQGASRSVVSNPRALLRTTTVRLAINVVQSAWRRRETCATPWLPESVDTRATPEAAAERQDTVERAVLLLMEALTPRQRAAFVLRRGFGYPYGRIAELLRLSVANTRQHVTRAQQRLATNDHPQPVDSVAYRRLVQAFLEAARSGDLIHLERALLADADSHPSEGRLILGARR